jgi:hypothetical protein
MNSAPMILRFFSGSVTPAAAQKFQHGHPGTVTILDVAKTLDPANAGTTKAIEAIVPTDGFGPVGLAVTPDGKHALVSASEGDQLEDGGGTISIIDLASNKVVSKVTQAWGNPAFRPTQSDSRRPEHGVRLLYRCERRRGQSQARTRVYRERQHRRRFGDHLARARPIPAPNRAHPGCGRPLGSCSRMAHWFLESRSARTVWATRCRSRRGESGGSEDAEVARSWSAPIIPQPRRGRSLASTPDGTQLIVSNFRSNVSCRREEGARRRLGAEPHQAPGGGRRIRGIMSRPMAATPYRRRARARRWRAVGDGRVGAQSRWPRHRRRQRNHLLALLPRP